MAIEISLCTDEDSPDPGFGGQEMSQHGLTRCQHTALGLNSEPLRTYRAFAFSALVHTNFTERRLKFLYRFNQGLGTEGTCTGIVQYTLNAGSSWITVMNLTNGEQAEVEFNLLLNPSQPLNQVQVRGSTDGAGVGADPVDYTLEIDNIRVEAIYPVRRRPLVVT